MKAGSGFWAELIPRQEALIADEEAVSSETAPGGPRGSSAARGSCQHLSGDQEEHPGCSKCAQPAPLPQVLLPVACEDPEAGQGLA